MDLKIIIWNEKSKATPLKLEKSGYFYIFSLSFQSIMIHYVDP